MILLAVNRANMVCLDFPQSVHFFCLLDFFHYLQYCSL